MLVINGILKRMQLDEVDGIKVLDADEEFKERFAALLRECVDEYELDEYSVVYTTRDDENRAVQTIPEELLPEVWAERLGYKIKDRDGWADKSFYTPITHEEFQQRLIVSTAERVEPKTE